MELSGSTTQASSFGGKRINGLPTASDKQIPSEELQDTQGLILSGEDVTDPIFLPPPISVKQKRKENRQTKKDSKTPCAPLQMLPRKIKANKLSSSEMELMGAFKDQNPNATWNQVAASVESHEDLSDPSWDGDVKKRRTGKQVSRAFNRKRAAPSPKLDQLATSLQSTTKIAHRKLHSNPLEAFHIQRVVLYEGDEDFKQLMEKKAHASTEVQWNFILAYLKYQCDKMTALVDRGTNWDEEKALKCMRGEIEPLFVLVLGLCKSVHWQTWLDKNPQFCHSLNDAGTSISLCPIQSYPTQLQSCLRQILKHRTVAEFYITTLQEIGSLPLLASVTGDYQQLRMIVMEKGPSHFRVEQSLIKCWTSIFPGLTHESVVECFLHPEELIKPDLLRVVQELEPSNQLLVLQLLCNHKSVHDTEALAVSRSLRDLDVNLGDFQLLLELGKRNRIEGSLSRFLNHVLCLEQSKQVILKHLEVLGQNSQLWKLELNQAIQISESPEQEDLLIKQVELMSSCSLPIDLFSKSLLPEGILRTAKTLGFRLTDYHSTILRLLLTNVQNLDSAVFIIPTGCGKSWMAALVAAFIIQIFEYNVVIIVPNNFFALYSVEHYGARLELTRGICENAYMSLSQFLVQSHDINMPTYVIVDEIDQCCLSTPFFTNKQTQSIPCLVTESFRNPNIKGILGLTGTLDKDFAEKALKLCMLPRQLKVFRFPFYQIPDWERVIQMGMQPGSYSSDSEEQVEDVKKHIQLYAIGRPVVVVVEDTDTAALFLSALQPVQKQKLFTIIDFDLLNQTDEQSSYLVLKSELHDLRNHNNAIVITTRQGGRGVDFRFLEGSNEAHVIICFRPDSASELRQIIGRSCREVDHRKPSWSCAVVKSVLRPASDSLFGELVSSPETSYANLASRKWIKTAFVLHHLCQLTSRDPIGGKKLLVLLKQLIQRLVSEPLPVALEIHKILTDTKSCSQTYLALSKESEDLFKLQRGGIETQKVDVEKKQDEEKKGDQL